MTTQTELLREVLNAAVMATWALAHAIEKDPSYQKAYDALSELTPKLRAVLAQPEQPAPQGWNRCQKRLREAGKTYPRTCGVCGLWGPCQFEPQDHGITGKGNAS